MHGLRPCELETRQRGCKRGPVPPAPLLALGRRCGGPGGLARRRRGAARTAAAAPKIGDGAQNKVRQASSTCGEATPTPLGGGSGYSWTTPGQRGGPYPGKNQGDLDHGQSPQSHPPLGVGRGLVFNSFAKVRLSKYGASPHVHPPTTRVDVCLWR